MKEKKEDTTWSIKHEGKLNPNNTIFTNNKYKELVSKLKKVDDSIKIDEDMGALISDCCNGSCLTEPIEDSVAIVGICSICGDWGDFIYEKDLEE